MLGLPPFRTRLAFRPSTREGEYILRHLTTVPSHENSLIRFSHRAALLAFGFAASARSLEK